MPCLYKESLETGTDEEFSHKCWLDPGRLFSISRECAVLYLPGREQGNVIRYLPPLPHGMIL